MELFRLRRNKGVMGVGTLIIFIAIILVAAISAMVIVAMAGNLQQTGIATGMDVEDSVATGIEAMSVIGSDATTDHTIEDLELLLRVQSGSEPINLNNTVILVDTRTTSQDLEYGGVGTAASGTTSYVVSYVKSGPDQENDYLTRGDVVTVYLTLSSSNGESERIRVRIVPRLGQTTLIEFITPSVMNDNRLRLWP